MARSFAFLSCLLFLFGCSSMERTPESGYAKSSTEKTESGWRKTTKSEKSYLSDSNSSDQKTELKQLENGISGKRELEQYSKALPWFNDDGEKVEFLRLRSYEQRQAWLINKDFASRSKRVVSQMQDLVETQDIAVGMPESLVKKSWGDPVEVEVSGMPEFHNQRWHYKKYVSSPDGYKSERKTVYFEGGKVVGWDVE